MDEPENQPTTRPALNYAFAGRQTIELHWTGYWIAWLLLSLPVLGIFFLPWDSRGKRIVPDAFIETFGRGFRLAGDTLLILVLVSLLVIIPATFRMLRETGWRMWERIVIYAISGTMLLFCIQGIIVGFRERGFGLATILLLGVATGAYLASFLLVPRQYARIQDHCVLLSGITSCAIALSTIILNHRRLEMGPGMWMLFYTAAFSGVELAVTVIRAWMHRDRRN